MSGAEEKRTQPVGPEISIVQSGVPCGLFQKRTEPGYLLADGTVLLESERDPLWPLPGWHRYGWNVPSDRAAVHAGP